MDFEHCWIENCWEVYRYKWYRRTFATSWTNMAGVHIKYLLNE